MNNGVFSGKMIPVRGNDIDTDRIIPARFMKCVTFEGLGKWAFNDERTKGQTHPFDDGRWAGHPVMAVNANFGCGSSREHAPQALKDYGITMIIGESFAEIFAGNCSSLGIPAVVLSPEDAESLQTLAENEPETTVTVSLKKMTVTAGSHSWNAQMPESYRQALLDGSWDSTSVLAQAQDAADALAAGLPYVNSGDLR